MSVAFNFMFRLSGLASTQDPDAHREAHQPRTADSSTARAVSVSAICLQGINRESTGIGHSLYHFRNSVGWVGVNAVRRFDAVHVGQVSSETTSGFVGERLHLRMGLMAGKASAAISPYKRQGACS